MASPPQLGNGPQLGDRPWRPDVAESDAASPQHATAAPQDAAVPPAPRAPADPLAEVPSAEPTSAESPATEMTHPEVSGAEASRAEASGTKAPSVQAPAGQPVIAAPPGSGKRRLAWLDALRGIAALCVVFDHLSYHDLEHVHTLVWKVFDPGLYGIAVFFLVSGFIIPASLERGGSVRRFWVGRVFRLYPLFLAAIAIVLVMHQFNIGTLRGADAVPKAAVFSHLLMLSDILGVPSVINVLWTLSFEMVFYLLLTALFVLGVHRRSGDYALGFGVAALALGGILPAVRLSHSALGVTKVAALADLLVIVGLLLAVSTRGLLRVFGASLAAGTGLVLLVFNDRRIPTEGFVILALMFTGTMLYRWQEGQLGRTRAIWTAVVVFALITAAGAWHIGQVAAPAAYQAGTPRRWVISLAAAGLTFGIGLALRNRSFPPFLAWLGLVSYSTYVLHYPVIYLYEKIQYTHGRHPIAIQLLLAAAFLAVLLAVAALSYRLVERPMQLLGRRVGKALDARMGSDRIVAGRHSAAAESAQ
jgi:peptidoglycan/LPS O-acetylase OafA/YrhL